MLLKIVKLSFRTFMLRGGEDIKIASRCRSLKVTAFAEKTEPSEKRHTVAKQNLLVSTHTGAVLNRVAIPAAQISPASCALRFSVLGMPWKVAGKSLGQSVEG